MEQMETIHDESKENHDEETIKIEQKTLDVKNHQQGHSSDVTPNQKVKKFKLDYKELQNRQNFDLSDPDDMEVVKTILKKASTARTKADIEILYKAFNDIKFIKEMERDVNQLLIRKMFKNIQFAPYGKRQVVFNQGDIGQSFYIIIQGSVWVLVPNKFSSGVTEEQLKISKDLIQNPDMYSRMTDDQFMSKVFPQFNLIATLKSGYSFGEIALRQQTVRTATVVCTEDTICAVVSREIFNSCISEFYKQQRDKEIKFLHQFHLFADLYKQDVEMILMSCIKHHFNKNYVIYSENQPSDRIFFLQEGEIEISKISDIFTENANDLYVSRTKDLNMAQLPFRNLGNTLSYKKTLKRVPVVKICPDSIFGEEEAFNNKKRETKAVVVSNDVTYYSLKIKDFYQIMYKKYPQEIIENLKRDILVEKIKHRQEKLCKNIIINQMYNSFEQKMREETFYSTNKLLNTTEIIRYKKNIKNSDFNSLNNTALVSYSNSPKTAKHIHNSLRESPPLFVTDPKVSLEKIKSFTPRIQNNDSTQHLLSSSVVFKNNNFENDNKILKSKFQKLTIGQAQEDIKIDSYLEKESESINQNQSLQQDTKENVATSFQKIFKKIIDTNNKEKYPDAINEMSYVSTPLSGRRLQSVQCKRNVQKVSQRTSTQQHPNSQIDNTHTLQKEVNPQLSNRVSMSPKQKIEDKIKKSSSLSQHQKKLILLSMHKQRRLNTPENNFYSFLENHNSVTQNVSSNQSKVVSPQRSASRNAKNRSPYIDSQRNYISFSSTIQEDQETGLNRSLRLQNQPSSFIQESQQNKRENALSSNRERFQLNKKDIISARAQSSNTYRDTKTVFYSNQATNNKQNQFQKQQNNFVRSPTKEQLTNSQNQVIRQNSQSLKQNRIQKQNTLKSNVDRNSSQSKVKQKKQAVLIMQPKIESFQRISCYDQEYDMKLKEMETDILNDQYECDQVEAKLIMSLAVNDIIQKDVKIVPIDNKNPLIDIDYIRKYDRENKLYSRKSMMQKRAVSSSKPTNQTPKNNDFIQKQKETLVTEERNSKFPQNYMHLIIDQQREKCQSAMASGQSTPKGNTFSSNPLRVSLARSRRISVNPGRFYLKGDRKQQFYDDFKEDFLEKEIQDITTTHEKTQETNISEEYAKVKPKYKTNSKLQFNVSIIGNEQRMEEFKRQVRSQLGKK